MEESLSIPIVSIVTPTLNQGEFIEETIESVLSQNYPAIEYLVIDGGSSDKTIPILKKYGNKLRWLSEPDRGQSHAINKGWSLSKGEIFAYLNADDLLDPQAVNVVVENFCRVPEAGIVHGDCVLIDTRGKKIGYLKGENHDFSKLLRDGQSKLAQPASFYRAKLVREVGMLDENLHLSMDYDLMLRLARVSSMVYVPRYLAYFRVHINSKSSNLTERHWKESFQVRSRYGGKRLLKPRLKYIQYRILKALPTSFQTLFRRWRGSAWDLVNLRAVDLLSDES